MISEFAQHTIANVDEWLDAEVGEMYHDQPLAQDLARVMKITEEAGEAIAELILWTGQNPRKPIDPDAKDRMLRELADTALTAIFGIQHFTKNAQITDGYLHQAILKIARRAAEAGYV